MIVDSHAHIWGKGFIPPAFFRETAERWAKKAPGRTPEMIMPKLLDGIVDDDGKLFIENMDQAGVDVTIINGGDLGYLCGEEPEVPIEKQLEFYEELHRRYPKRLHFFFSSDPRRENGLHLLEKAVREWGCIGCGEFATAGFYITDEVAQPIFKKCTDLGIPVFIHTRAGSGAEMVGEDYTLKNPAHPFHIKALQANYPDLVIIFGHAGYPFWWEEACRIARGSPNCYLDLSNWSLELSKQGDLIAKIACMRDMVGADHILFSSDQVSGKRFCGEKSELPGWVNFFKNLPEEAKRYGYQFTNAEVELILGGNAKRILHL
jgi:predicted TIM-barrel fold metal-dependent hydrolase